MRQLRTVAPVLAPVALVAATAIVGSFFERSTEIYFINALVSVSIVVALYVFVGNSGVLSFGHISFVAVGAWTAGVLSVPVEEKPATMPNLFGFLSDTTVGNVPSLLLAALVGGAVRASRGAAADAAVRVSPPASPPSPCSRSRATSSATTSGSARGSTSSRRCRRRPTCSRPRSAPIVVIGVAFAYQVSRFGRQLRAARDDAPAARAVGISVYRQRLIAFALSGALGGVRRRALRPLPADQRRRRLPRPHLHHARDARDRRHDEPLGRRRRRSRGLGPRLAARGGGERRWAASTSRRAVGSSSSAR